jgi:hypothetical protein
MNDGEKIMKIDSLDDTTISELLDVTSETTDFTIEVREFDFSNDGNNLYVVARIASSDPDIDTRYFIYQFDLSTAYDITTAEYADKKTNVTGTTFSSSNIDTFQVSYNGEHVYASNFNDNTLHHYSILDYDISTLSDTGETLTKADFPGMQYVYMFHVQDNEPSGLYRKVFAVGDINNSLDYGIESVNLDDESDTWSLASTRQEDILNLGVALPARIMFSYGSSPGEKMYMHDDDTDEINSYDLSTAWNVSTATFANSLAQPTTGFEMPFRFIDDGTKLYMGQSDEIDDNFYPYTLSTAYDISTATAGTSFNLVNPSITSTQGLALHELNGEKSLYYTYNTTDDAGMLGKQIGVYNLETDTNYPNWFWQLTSTNLEKIEGDDFFFEFSSNGFLYLFGDKKVYRIAGSELDGEYGGIQDLLSFNSEHYISDAADYRGNIYIAIQKGNNVNLDANYSNSCGVFIWNRSSGQSNMRDYISIQGAKKIVALWISHSGKLMLVSINSNDRTELREMKRNAFPVVAELERGAYPANREMVSSGPNGAWWIGVNGKVYSFGNIAPGDTDNFYRFGQLVPNDSTFGMMFYGGQSAGNVSGDNWDEVESFYISYDDGSPQVKLWAPHANADGDYPNQVSEQGDVYTPVTYLPQMSTLKNIEIYCARTSLSDSTTLATLKFYINQSTTPFLIKTVKAEDAVRGYIDIALDKPFVNSFQMEVEWNNSLALSEDLFYPSQAIVRYEKTSTKG